MLELSDPACRELDAFFDEKEKSPIRIYLAPGGCSGPRLSLALDNPTDADQVLEVKGYSFCINKELLQTAKSVSVDFSDMGFMVRSEVPFGGGGCSGCSGGASSGCSTDSCCSS